MILNTKRPRVANHFDYNQKSRGAQTQPGGVRRVSSNSWTVTWLWFSLEAPDEVCHNDLSRKAADIWRSHLLSWGDSGGELSEFKVSLEKPRISKPGILACRKPCL
jgi:hypothetical protein